MKFDDASWHYGGDFPKDLPNEAGATHIGLYLAWCLLNKLGRGFHDLTDLRNRSVTPGIFFIENCDEKFTSEDLSLEGQVFTKQYYGESDSYINDYDSVLGSESIESLYHIQDCWENYDKLEKRLTEAFVAWKATDPDLTNPAERYRTTLAEVAKECEALGYKYAKSGPHLTKSKDGVKYKISFFHQSEYKEVSIIFDVFMNKYKKWQESQKIHPCGRVFGAVYYDVFYSKNRCQPLDFDVILRIVKTELDPFFETFFDKETFEENLKIPKWELESRLRFLAFLGRKEEALQMALDYLKNLPSLHENYGKEYLNIAQEGYEFSRYCGDYAFELAMVSHQLGFGDLLKQI